ncbi:MAG: hypothetical protein JWP26_3767 [Devosia sp.]|uniref:DUF1223 domain-containing protein n=1 Tax=Devosia sp. TaxID=1871048 RepID=UPI00262D6D98|nr:DUF1223 domain-containing protein [Devosia sp.]MDB5588797.1 hypothetical protein [Devosia sp.]
MRHIHTIALSLLAASAGMGLSSPAQAAGKAPVVVELFTSQGCSSCPPANANLITLSQRPDVLALSFAVTYWDRLGWKDTFGKPEFTQRQVTYEPALEQFGPYTPQMVVNGTTTAVGNHIADVERLIDTAPALTGPTIELADSHVDIAAGTAPTSGADVWLVRYDPQIHEVPIGRGENTGRTLPHTHVVYDLQNLGTWSGAPLALGLSAPATGLKTAILVQRPNGGPILSATTN